MVNEIIEKHPIATIIIIVGILIVGSQIINLFTGGGFFGFFTGYREKAQEYTSADYAIEHYKFFIDKYNAIRQMGSMISNSEADIDEFKEMHPDPSTWTRTENEQYSELTFVRNGYVQQYDKFVTDYNARMRDLTTNQMWMKPQNYPASIPLYTRESAITKEFPELILPPR